MTAEKLSLGTPGRHFSWRKILIYLLGIVILHRMVLILFTHRSRPHVVETEAKLGYSKLYYSSWESLTVALGEARPKIRSIGHLSPVDGIPVEKLEQPTNIEALETRPSDINSLRKSHIAFMKRINDRSLSVIYQPGTFGVVTTAGPDDLPAILVQMRLLRRTGSKLPVQVFLLNHDDYDAKICKVHLRKLNAECKIIEEFTDSSAMPKLPKSLKERKINANEPLHKLLAIFFSRFDEVLLLDPATLVYNNPDPIVKEEPFLSTGLIMWPDFWASTVSAKLFSVQDAPAEKRNLRDKLRSVDMGQLLLSKSMHSATLLLSIYYTYYGENLYDSLLMQSSAGEKGSQSIKAAARLLDLPYFMVKRNVEAVGYPDKDRQDQGFHGVAMQHPYPSDDYHRMAKERQRPLFVRANNPMLHAAFIMDKGVTTFTGKMDGGGRFATSASASLQEESSLTHHRMWEWFDGRHASNGWRDPDPERAAWEEMWRVSCLDAKHFSSWPLNTEDTDTNCQRITQHREVLGWKEFFIM